MKNYPQAIEDMIDSGLVRTCTLLEYLTSTPIYFTTTSYQIEHDSKIYLSSQEFTDLEDFTTNAEMEIAELQLSFSMLNGIMPAIGLASDFYGKRVIIKRGFIGDDNTIIGTEVLWRGITTQYSDNETVMTVTITNAMGAFDNMNPWRTTPASHKKRHPNDECMKFSKDAEKIIMWGGEYSGGKRRASSSKKEDLELGIR